jgi:hypothetical protein
MRGGIFHEHMIEVLEKTFKKRGFQTRRQVPSRKGKKGGYIDLLVSNNDDSVFLIIEVEMRKARVLNDIQKQTDFGNGAILWIVPPTRELATEIKNHLKDHGIEESETLFILPFGAAIKRILNKKSTYVFP